MQIFVRNLADDTSEEDIQALFKPYGDVTSVTIVKDTVTGVPAGFGFVDMLSQSEAISAVNGLRGATVRGRELKFDASRSRFERRRRDERRIEERQTEERRTRERRDDGAE